MLCVVSVQQWQRSCWRLFTSTISRRTCRCRRDRCCSPSTANSTCRSKNTHTLPGNQRRCQHRRSSAQVWFMWWSWCERVICPSLPEGARCCVDGWPLFLFSCPSWATVTQLCLLSWSFPSMLQLPEETKSFSAVCRHTHAGSTVRSPVMMIMGTLETTLK